MTDELNDTDINNTVPYNRDDDRTTKVKWSIETKDIDNRFLRNYDNVHKSMEDRQITDFYEAQRHIQSAMMGDTPVQTVQNRQYIDNVSDCDSEHHRISKSVHHRLDLGPISLPGAQQHITVETDFREAHINRTILNMALATNPIFREAKLITTEVEAMARVLSNSEDAVVVGPIIRVTMALTNISITQTINRQNSMAHPVAYAVVSIIPLSTATKENMT